MTGSIYPLFQVQATMKRISDCGYYDLWGKDLSSEFITDLTSNDMRQFWRGKSSSGNVEQINIISPNYMTAAKIASANHCGLTFDLTTTVKLGVSYGGLHVRNPEETSLGDSLPFGTVQYIKYQKSKSGFVTNVSFWVKDVTSKMLSDAIVEISTAL